jgi:hypothetical protein
MAPQAPAARRRRAPRAPQMLLIVHAAQLPALARVDATAASLAQPAFPAALAGPPGPLPTAAAGLADVPALFQSAIERCKSAVGRALQEPCAEMEARCLFLCPSSTSILCDCCFCQMEEAGRHTGIHPASWAADLRYAALKATVFGVCKCPACVAAPSGAGPAEKDSQAELEARQAELEAHKAQDAVDRKDATAALAAKREAWKARRGPRSRQGLL